MAWITIDDQFADHPKIVTAGPLATHMHMMAMVYCGRYLTDGFVPRGIVPRLVDWTHIGIATGGSKGLFEVGHDVEWTELVETLVDVGLWEPIDGGWNIHDYLDYNLTKAEILERRAKATARQDKHRNKVRDEQGRYIRDKSIVSRVTNGVTNDSDNALVTPYPIPIPNHEEQQHGATGSNGHDLGADAPGEIDPPKRKPRRATERSEIESAMMAAFLKATGYTLPQRIQDVNWWYSELREIAPMVDNNVGRAVTLIADAVREMQHTRVNNEPLRIGDPKSIIKVARSLAAKKSQGVQL